MGDPATTAIVIGMQIATSLLRDTRQDSQKQPGPHPEAIRMQTSEYGVAIPLVFGTMTIGGNLIWASTPVSEGSDPDNLEFYVSFAVQFCAGPVTAVSKIFFDGQLVDPHTYCTSSRVYLGTEDQAADSVIEADKGVGSTPAYRGTCYIVFERLHLNQTSFAIPAVTISVTDQPAEVGQPVFLQPSDSSGVPYDLQTRCLIDPQAESVFVRETSGIITRMDIDSGDILANDSCYFLGPITFDLDGAGDYYSIERDERDLTPELWRIVKRDRETLAILAYSENYGWAWGSIPLEIRLDINRGFILWISSTREQIQYVPIADLTTFSSPGIFNAVSGRAWSALSRDNSAGYFYALQVKKTATPRTITLHLLDCDHTQNLSVDVTDHLEPDDYATNVFLTGGFLPESGVDMPFAVVTVKLVDGSYRSAKYWVTYLFYGTWLFYAQFRGELTDVNLIPATTSLASTYHRGIWGHDLYFHGGTSSQIWRLDGDAFTLVQYRYDPPDWPGYDWGGPSVFDHSTDDVARLPALICCGQEQNSSARDGWWRFSLIPTSSSPTSVDLVIREVCELCGLDGSADLDLDSVGQASVWGYIVNNRMSGLAAINNLIDAFLLDAHETEDGQIRVAARSHVVAMTIPEADLGVAAEGGSVGKLPWEKLPDDEIPVECELSFLDPARDFERGVRRAFFSDLAGGEKVAIDYPIGVTGQQAEDMAWERLRFIRESASTYHLSLGRKYAVLDPGDLLEVIKTGVHFFMRAEQGSYEGALVKIDCSAQDPDEDVVV